VTRFERRHEPLLPKRLFLARMARFAGFSAGILVASLIAGILGYRYIVGLSWLDALLNASMILTGMGPVDPMRSTGAKLFASFYALFSGVVFLTSMGVLAAPFVHRLMHRFHIASND